MPGGIGAQAEAAAMRATAGPFSPSTASVPTAPPSCSCKARSASACSCARAHQRRSPAGRT
jgi:hypothetical protein